MRWEAFAREVPALARRSGIAFRPPGVAILATLRPDGTPRISAVEPVFSEGCLLLGLMRWSGKAADVRRDPRCELHSAILDREGRGGEVALQGRAVEAPATAIKAARVAWWADAAAAQIVELDIESATLVTWSLSRGRMHLTRWTPASGSRKTSRRYP